MEVKFTFEDNRPIKPGDIPPNTTHLIFGDYYNQKIDIDVLPSNLTRLTFGWNYNQKIDIDTLPEGLTHLTFGFCYNQKIDIGDLPDNLTHLTFGYGFYKPPLLINGKSIFPNNLQEIHFKNKIRIIDHKAFNDMRAEITISDYVNNIIINITENINILNLIDKMLPMPIAEEIVHHVFDEFPNIV